MSSKFVPQGHWGWKIATYLFLAGAGSGAFVTGSVADYLGGEYATLAKIGITMSAPLVFVGMLFLIFDLGLKRNAFHAFAHVRSSWISRGSWIISIFIVLSALETMTRYWPFEWLASQRSLDLTLEVIASALAVATMVYSGLVLGASKPIAFWSTPLLPLLFFVSASSCGVMLVLFGGAIFGIGTSVFIRLIQADIVLILAELLVIALFLQGTHRVEESRYSARMCVGGKLAKRFWGGVVAAGLVLPLTVEIFLVASPSGNYSFLISVIDAIAMLFGLSGGLLLRKIVLSAGVYAPLRVGSISVPVPSQFD